jgi:hypothetical protein
MGQQQDPSKSEQQAEDKPESITRDDVVSLINAAMTNHGKRQEKALADAIAKALEPLKGKTFSEGKGEEPEGKPSKGGETEKLQKQLADMQKRLDDAEKARQAEAEARRRDLTQGQLRTLLEEKGIRKEALDILVTAMAANGTLRYDDDGKPQLAIKRARSKGAAADEQVFDDLKQGVEDWVKSDVAAAFIKAPSSPLSRPAANGTAPKQFSASSSPEDKAAQIAELMRSTDQ